MSLGPQGIPWVRRSLSFPSESADVPVSPTGRFGGFRLIFSGVSCFRERKKLSLTVRPFFFVQNQRRVKSF